MDVVTGAFSYTGRAIAEELLRRGRPVRTLSRRDAPDDPLAARIERAELQFRDERALREALAGTETLYNTYWVRFAHGATTFDRAVANTRLLLRAAREAGVRRVVHVSVTNPSRDPMLSYFRGKTQVEEDVRASGLLWAIVRPTLVFGQRDILVNNIAWALRRTPVFPVAGDGRYRVQPVSVEMSRRSAQTPASRTGTSWSTRLGPRPSATRSSSGSLRPRSAAAPGSFTCRPGLCLHWRESPGGPGDVLLTPEELAGLQAELLVSSEPPLGTASFRSWVAANGESLGRHYVSELARNFRPYDPI